MASSGVFLLNGRRLATRQAISEPPGLKLASVQNPHTFVAEVSFAIAQPGAFFISTHPKDKELEALKEQL